MALNSSTLLHQPRIKVAKPFAGLSVKRPRPLHNRVSRRARQEAGTGLIEFLLVALPLLVTALGGIELSHWMFTRQAISMALLEAGRAGATQHANPQAIADAFEQALAPLYPSTAKTPAGERVQAAIKRHQKHHGQLPWHIQVVSPAAVAFQDFAVPTGSIRHPSGLPTINNSYQYEQHQAGLGHGWPEGKGPRSDQTIFQANELVLRLTYRYRPLLPGLEKIAGHTLALTQEAILTMQSHPVLWPDDPVGRVTRLADASANRHWPAVTNPSGHVSPQPNPGGMTTEGQSKPLPNPVTEGTAANEPPATDPSAANGEFQGDDAAGVSDDNICTNTSPSRTIPNSDLARSSTASRPDLRS